MKFKDLAVGDTFDFVQPESFHNSFFDRCVKVSTRCYEPLEGNLKGYKLQVGSISADVYHVEKESAQ